MKRSAALWALPALLALLGGATGQDATAPWVISMDHGPLEVLNLTYRDGSARGFYYMTFKLDNNSQQAAKLALNVRAFVDAGRKKQRWHTAIPYPDVEEAVRRLARASDLKNVQQINGMGTLDAGQSVRGIAVLGTFHREWDEATLTVSGLEPAAISCRIRKFGSSGFTLAHRAYYHHNERVRQKAGKDPQYTESSVILKHDVIWKMRYQREGDEYAPQVDPIILMSEGWDVVEDPSPSVVYERKPPFGGE